MSPSNPRTRPPLRLLTAVAPGPPTVDLTRLDSPSLASFVSASISPLGAAKGLLRAHIVPRNRPRAHTLSHTTPPSRSRISFIVSSASTSPDTSLSQTLSRPSPATSEPQNLRRMPRPSIFPAHNSLVALEAASKFMRARTSCAMCGITGPGFPRCPWCGDAWCSRQCRMASGEGHGHGCKARAFKTTTT